jgi:hypothetical protein
MHAADAAPMRRTSISGFRPAHAVRIAAMVLPTLGVATVTSNEPRPRPAPPPGPHAVDVWMGHDDAVTVDPRWAQETARARLSVTATQRPLTLSAVPGGLGAGFQMVGSVAVLQGDDLNTNGTPARRGMDGDTLARVGQQFITAFGDYYDEIAVFLAFKDNATPTSLAYYMPIKNDTQGLGLGLFDASEAYGSPTGRLQGMLNMKRVLAYGLGAADDPDNDLYAVWAQEAAHRWLAYFRFRRETDTENQDTLLFRQKAHWAGNVQSDASLVDGVNWRDNGDGTFTALERDKRYGPMDQYGMGLLAEKDVPPIFMLEDVKRTDDDMPVDLRNPFAVARGIPYTARKVVITVQDVIRAVGPRIPATDPAAADMRMGVVLVISPDSGPDEFVGESFRIDHTRRLWTDYYNTAGGGRGKVCTELLRPCRGLSLTFGEARLTAAGPSMVPGQPFKLTVPVTNAGDAAGAPKIKADARGALTLSRDTVDLDVASLAPGQTANAVFEGYAPHGVPCAQPLPIDFVTVDTRARPSPSAGITTVMVGVVPGPLDNLDGAGSGAWKVNPDGTDTAMTGRWELATPERSDAFDFVVQPGAAFSGQRAFVTGAARGTDPSANDVSGGLTTVESPPLSLAGLTTPHLVYQAYFVAADFINQVLVPGAADSLRVLASADGATWTELDRLGGMALGWQRRVIKLADKLPPEVLSAQSLRLRFVAEDADINTVVEAVVDDVGLVGEAPACAIPAVDGGADASATAPPGGGCECGVGRGGRPASGIAFLLVLLAGLRRRRSRALSAR